jgi:UDP-N-acetyl-D-glucosamine dehydrogenase
VRAVEAAAATLRREQLVILESTTYPGTTDEVVQPMLEAGGLKAEVDFFLAFSPERVDPGNAQFTTRNIPKVVGGIGPASTEVAAALYKQNMLNKNLLVNAVQYVSFCLRLLSGSEKPVNYGIGVAAKAASNSLVLDQTV